MYNRFPTLLTNIGAPANSYDTDAQVFFTAAGITDNTQKSAVNTLVLSLKSYGIWTKMYAVYPFVGGTATTHKYNLKDPRDLDAAFRVVWGGTVTHDANGITGSANGRGDTKFVPSTNGFSLSSGGFGTYLRTAPNSGSISFGSTSEYIYMAGSTLNTYYATVSTNGTVSNFLGLLSVGCLSNNLTGYRNGVSVGTSTIGGGSVATTSMYLLSYDGMYNFCTANVAFAYLSQNLNSTESGNLYTAVQAFQTTLSRNV